LNGESKVSNWRVDLVAFLAAEASMAFAEGEGAVPAATELP
jgi:hypothetical protein